jgi:hypothetical protein
MKMQLYDYDVWGNDRDGYEVNNIYPALTGFDLFHAEDVIIDVCESDTDKQIVQKLKKSGWLKKTIKDSKVTITGEMEFQLFLEYCGRPACELRPYTE